jgi:hypothetical protein
VCFVLVARRTRRCCLSLIAEPCQPDLRCRKNYDGPRQRRLGPRRPLFAPMGRNGVAKLIVRQCDVMLDAFQVGNLASGVERKRSRGKLTRLVSGFRNILSDRAPLIRGLSESGCRRRLGQLPVLVVR